MEDISDLPGSDDTTLENPRSSRGDLNQDKTEKMVASSLVTRIKDYKV